MNTAAPRTGGCQCGNIKYRLNAAPQMLYVCHCRDCQRQSSSAFGMSLIMNVADIEFLQGEQRLKSWDTRGDDGAIKRCSFCPDCGTRIMHATDDPRASVSIKAGSLDDTSWLQPIAHIWLRSAQPWVPIDRSATRCYEREPENGDELAELWRQRTQGN